MAELDFALHALDALVLPRDRLVLAGGVARVILPCMSDQGSDDDQRRDALLLRLLKMPPQSRAETAERARRAKGKPTRTYGTDKAGPQHRTPKAKERPASKGRVHKGKTGR